MNMDWEKKGKNELHFRHTSTHTADKSDFIPSLKWEDIRLWRWRGAAAAEKLRWGLRASCSGYRLTEASDPATTSLSKVTQANSEHKRLFLPDLLELASIKSSAGSLSLKMADFSKHLRPKLLKLFGKLRTSSPCPKNILYRLMAW